MNYRLRICRFVCRSHYGLRSYGATIYDSEMDAVTFEIPGGAFGPLGLIAHEFKHGYQFLTGEIDLGVKGLESYGYIFYDQTDEQAAYLRGELFGADHFSIMEIANGYNYLESIKKDSFSTLQGKKVSLEQLNKITQRANLLNRVLIIDGILIKPKK